MLFRTVPVILIICSLLILLNFSGKAEEKNPFGITLKAQSLSEKNLKKVIEDLHTGWYRPAPVFLNRWNGRDPDPEIETVKDMGLSIALTVRNNGGIYESTTPPSNREDFKRILAEVLHIIKPSILVVENEENNRMFYKGTVGEYGGELKASVEVAHSKNIPCTNGGLTCKTVTLLVYQHYIDEGKTDKARAFARRSFNERLLWQAENKPDELMPEIKKGREFLKIYREANIDYVNFHWYVSDPVALEETVTYMKKETGLPVIINEIGLLKEEEKPEKIKVILKKITDMKVPLAIWYSVDGPHSNSLFGNDGKLRETGKTFKNFIIKTFGQ
ncbi:MAG: glycosyl hydrolase [Candidatus Eremiobacterota bacterium]